MTNQMKEFYEAAITELKKGGAENPVKVLSPLIQFNTHSQFSKLTGHINNCTGYHLEYSNASEGYNDGYMTALFFFKSSRPKLYTFKFSSVLRGDYGTTEWFSPLVDTSVSEEVGKPMSFNGSKEDFKHFEEEIKRELANEEVQKLKQKIGDLQRKLAAMAKAI